MTLDDLRKLFLNPPSAEKRAEAERAEAADRAAAARLLLRQYGQAALDALDKEDPVMSPHHLRGDGSPCAYYAEDFCNKCGWCKDVAVPAKDADLLTATGDPFDGFAKTEHPADVDLTKNLAREISLEIDKEWAETYGAAAVAKVVEMEKKR